MEAGTRQKTFTRQPERTNPRTAIVVPPHRIELVAGLLVRNVAAHIGEARVEGAWDVALSSKGLLERATSAEN
jgi:hypothetical protein